MKHIRHFKNIEEYNNHKGSNSFITPNVSFIETERVEDRVVMYSPKEEDDLPYVSIPDNTIYYYASSQLAEEKSGNLDKIDHAIFPNRFQHSIIDHSFENGIGIITFEDKLTEMNIQDIFIHAYLTNIIFPKSLSVLGIRCFYHCEIDQMTILNRDLQINTNGGNESLNNSSGILKVPKGSDYSRWLTNSLSDWTIEYIRTDE